MKTVSQQSNEYLQPKIKNTGFYYTMGANREEAWPLAVDAIAKATKFHPESAAAFLNSPRGEEFAQHVIDAMEHCTPSAAISLVTVFWMRMPTDVVYYDGKPSKYTHIPRLIRFVEVHEQIRTKKSEKQTPRYIAMATIAKDLGFPELADGSGEVAVEFEEVAVWQVKQALEAAYEAGRKSVKGGDNE